MVDKTQREYKIGEMMVNTEKLYWKKHSTLEKG